MRGGVARGDERLRERKRDAWGREDDPLPRRCPCPDRKIVHGDLVSSRDVPGAFPSIDPGLRDRVAAGPGGFS